MCKANISTQLSALIKTGNIPHAALFEGGFSLENAEYFAKAVVCTGENAPCDKCNACKKATDGNHPDIIMLTPQKENNPYPVDFVREIRASAFIVPNEAARKVFIFTNTDNISVQSQNALLKILEEPPKTAVFALCCTKHTQLLDTVISRVTRFNCGASENEKSSEIVALADDIAKCALFENEYALLKMTNPLIKERAQLMEVLTELQSLFRCIYLLKSGVDESVIEKNPHSQLALELKSRTTLNMALKMEKAAITTQSDLLMNSNAQLSVTRLCALLKSAV